MSLSQLHWCDILEELIYENTLNYVYILYRYTGSNNKEYDIMFGAGNIFVFDKYKVMGATVLKELILYIGYK